MQHPAEVYLSAPRANRKSPRKKSQAQPRKRRQSGAYGPGWTCDYCAECRAYAAEQLNPSPATPAGDQTGV